LKRFPLFGSLFALGLGVQLWARTDHRFVAMTAFLVILCCWGVMWHEVARQRTKPYWIVAAAAIAIFLALIVAPATSKDFNSYALYGRMVAKYDASPYTHEPVDFAADPWFTRTSYFWTDSPSVYGPVFTGLSAGVMEVADTSVLKARLGFQGLAALSLVGCIALASRRIGWPRAAIIVGCNPLLLTFGVNDAHCDVLIGFFVLAAVLALERRWYFAGGVLLALAASVKIAALPAVGGALFWIAWREGGVCNNSKKIASFFIGVVLAMGALLLAAGGSDALTPLRDATGRHTRFSVWNPLHQLITNHSAQSLPTHATADNVISMCASVVVVVIGLALMWRHRKDTNAVVAVVVGLVVYQFFGAYVLSWYAAWSLPALALAAGSRTSVVAMAHGSWVAVAYFSGYGGIAVLAVAVILAVGKRADLRRVLRSATNRESLAA